MRFLSYFSLPLLSKELIEQAQSKRTYILRVIYALGLYGVTLFTYGSLVGIGSAGGLRNLGLGQVLFGQLVSVQIFMILVLLPAITCGALTVEKEKDTLALLILTKLSSWTIVFEKLLSRVFAMGTYQLISLPLFAIVYGIGGVDLETILFAIICLIAMTTIVGSISILCSTWFRTTSTAFVMTYVVLFCLFCFTSVAFSAMAATPIMLPGWLIWSYFLGLVLDPMVILIASTVFSLLILVLAASVLVRRAFLPPQNLVLEIFRRADRFFTALNEATTGGIVLVNDQVALPEFNPVAWRETRKKSLGTFRYQFRILMLLLTPLIFAIVVILSESRHDFTNPFHVFPFYFWIVSIICLTVHSTGVIPSERIRQTLDVLLVTPLTSKSLVMQKLSGVRRLIAILSVPFAILVSFQAIWTGYVLSGSTIVQKSDFWLEIVATSLSAIIYMPLIMWIGFQMSLRLRTQMQAILATFAFIGAICAVPAILLVLSQVTVRSPASILRPTTYASAFLDQLRWLSPVEVMTFIAFRSQAMNHGMNSGMQPMILIHPIEAWFKIGIHFFLYGLLWWQLRRNALRSFSSIVNRGEPVETTYVTLGETESS